MRRRIIIIALVTLAACIGAIFGSAAMYGRGIRAYFSPDTFQSRWQSEYLIPIAAIPLYRSDWEYQSRWEIADYLVSKGYWSATPTAEPHWLLTDHDNRLWRDGATPFAVEMIGNAKEWMNWTEANPEFASVLWPRLLATLRQPGEKQTFNAYMLLSLAKTARNVEAFQRFLVAE